MKHLAWEVLQKHFIRMMLSANCIIKRKTNYKACEWPEFCRLAKDLVEEQENEIEKAVIAVGE